MKSMKGILSEAEPFKLKAQEVPPVELKDMKTPFKEITIKLRKQHPAERGKPEQWLAVIEATEIDKSYPFEPKKIGPTMQQVKPGLKGKNIASGRDPVEAIQELLPDLKKYYVKAE